MDTAQNAFADALAKRTAEKLVDNIMPSNNSRQPEGNYGPSVSIISFCKYHFVDVEKILF